MRRLIRDLRGIHEGKDIWVIAAGASMDYVAPDFFENKIVIGVNQVYRKYPCTYTVRKEAFGAKEAVESGVPVLLSAFDAGNFANKLNDHVKAGCKKDAEVYYYEHLNNGMTKVNFPEPEKDMLVVSFSTITTAMHAAAYMGANNIILCGHDCGVVDNKSAYHGYYPPEGPQHVWNGDWNKYRQWLSVIEPQTIDVKRWLIYNYNVHVFSLNPWVNFGLEGHSYER